MGYVIGRFTFIFANIRYFFAHSDSFVNNIFNFVNKQLIY